MVLISSKTNDRVKQIRGLSNKKVRDETGTFFAEGERVVRAAVETGASVVQAVVCNERLTREERVLAEALEERHAPMLEVTGGVFDSLSFREEGQSIGAVVEQ